MKIKELKQYTDKKIAILGYGIEGKSNHNFFKKLGFSDITILDKNLLVKKEKNCKYILGDNYISNDDSFDLIIKSPGISPYLNDLSKFKCKIITSIEIFFDNYDGKVIGITGTKGKSTTSTLIYKTLSEIGYNTKLVGNIGKPILDEVDLINHIQYDYIVYEVSSYMLEGIKISPFIGIINNIYDCHLDWHNGITNYKNAKLNILRGANFKLINSELQIGNIGKNTYSFGKQGKYSYNNGLFYIGRQQQFKNNKIALQGEHNKINITVVLGVIDIINPNSINKNIESLQKIIESFHGLSHRLEDIGEYYGIKFIDDAIATTPESTIAAIKTYEHNIGTILLGGYNSGFKFDNLIKILIKYNIPNIVLFPDTGNKIFGDLSDHEYESEFILTGDYNPKILKTKSMQSAVKFGFKNTEQGKICILSNAAPSFSLWSGYIEKGLSFQKEVKNYKKDKD